MKPSSSNFVMPVGLVAIGVAVGATGIYVGELDDAPGAAFIGLLLMLSLVTLGVGGLWRRRTHLSS